MRARGRVKKAQKIACALYGRPLEVLTLLISLYSGTELWLALRPSNPEPEEEDDKEVDNFERLVSHGRGSS